MSIRANKRPGGANVRSGPRKFSKGSKGQKQRPTAEMTAQPSLANDNPSRTRNTGSSHVSIKNSATDTSNYPPQRILSGADRHAQENSFGGTSRDASAATSNANESQRISNMTKKVKGAHAAMMGADNGRMPFNTTQDVPMCMFRGTDPTCNSLRELWYCQLIIAGAGPYNAQKQIGSVFTYPCKVLAFSVKSTLSVSTGVNDLDTEGLVWLALMVKRIGTTITSNMNFSVTNTNVIGPWQDVIGWALGTYNARFHGTSAVVANYVCKYPSVIEIKSSRTYEIYEGDSLIIAAVTSLSGSQGVAINAFAEWWTANV